MVVYYSVNGYAVNRSTEYCLRVIPVAFKARMCLLPEQCKFTANAGITVYYEHSSVIFTATIHVALFHSDFAHMLSA